MWKWYVRSAVGRSHISLLGWDTLFLARKVLTKTSGIVYGFDIQDVALKMTSDILRQELSDGELVRVRLYRQSHESFPDMIKPESISAIMYNLGYLPGGDKKIITLPRSTLQSIASGQKLLRPGGIMTILCYRGHPGGKDETNMVLDTLGNLDNGMWKLSVHNLLSSSDGSPLLVDLQKRL
jgi:hypothetical protein